MMRSATNAIAISASSLQNQFAAAAALSAAILLAPAPVSASVARPQVAAPVAAVLAADFEQIQYRGPYGGRGYGARPGPGPGPGPRYYGPPRGYGGGPRFAPGPRWGYRPWYHRPYYGTIIGGIALGTIVGAAAYGMAPPRPRPDLCWYWADDVQSRGYWDYC